MSCLLIEKTNKMKEKIIDCGRSYWIIIWKKKVHCVRRELGSSLIKMGVKFLDATENKISIRLCIDINTRLNYTCEGGFHEGLIFIIYEAFKQLFEL